MRRQIGRFVRPACQQGGTLFNAEADIAGDFLPVLLADQRPDLGVWIGWVAYPQAVGAFGKTLYEFRVDALLDKDA